jgi:hypothetical protein
MKLLINKCNHGFTLSERQKALFPVEPEGGYARVDRSDERLIASFEAGDNRGDGGSTLTLVEIPDGTREYKISALDGFETLEWIDKDTGETHTI